MQGEDVSRDGINTKSNVLIGAAAFEGAKVGTKDLFSCVDVLQS